MSAAEDGPGTRLSFWIGRELREERERFGIGVPEVLMATGEKDQRTIKKLEDGESMNSRIEHFVREYAYITGAQDPREFWDRALSQWHGHGHAPRFEIKPGPAGAFAAAIREQSLQKKRDNPEMFGKLRASQ